MPYRPYSWKKKVFKGTIFVIFKFIVVHIRNWSRDKIPYYNCSNALNLEQYDITQSN